MTSIVTKSLAMMEDLEVGINKVTQARNNTEVTGSKIYLPVPVDSDLALADIDVLKYKYAVKLVNLAETYYRYNAAAISTDEGVQSSVGPGKWQLTGASAIGSAAAGKGDALVIVKQPFSGSIARTQHDKNAESVLPADFGAIGNGVDDDTAKFALLEAAVSGKEIDLGGLAYAVSAVPTGNRYYNGQWIVPSAALPTAFVNVIRQWDLPNNLSGAGGGGLAIGTNAAANIPDLSSANPSQSFIAIGRDALGNSPRGRSCIAIGAGTMSKNSPGFANIAIGDFALQNVAGTSSAAAVLTGSRNIAIGTLALHFLTSGALNTFIGRDSGHCSTTGSSNVGVGYRAISGGLAPVGLSGLIENQTPSVASGQVAVGESALQNSQGDYNLAIGHFAGRTLKAGSLNTIVGGLAGNKLDTNLSWNNKVTVAVNIAGTYSQTGNTIAISAVASGVVAGNKVRLSFTSGGINAVTGDSQYMTVAAVLDANNFTVQSPVALDTAGNVTIEVVETATTKTNSGTNTIVGAQALQNTTNTNGATVVGWQAGGLADMSGFNNTLVGQRAGYSLTTGTNVTCIGLNAGRAASVATFNNFTALGAESTVTGSNQVQLGDSSTTTYVYGTVQNRSDAKDKTDVRDTSLGIDFILGLRPVDGRWDLREDYFEDVEEVVIDPVTKAASAQIVRKYKPKDGSKKRERFHHWFIAQEVKELCDKLGVDFGGYQDHTVNGGSDVCSLGYDEFIPPVVKAVQQCWTRMNELEARLVSLESANSNKD